MQLLCDTNIYCQHLPVLYDMEQPGYGGEERLEFLADEAGVVLTDESGVLLTPEAEGLRTNTDINDILENEDQDKLTDENGKIILPD